MSKEYELNIDPRILELLGPSLYTNIYYVLAELIANAYDADASNVYVYWDDSKIIVEDDGKGMSYENKDIEKYLNVASVSRNSSADELTKEKRRRKMGRKGVGKLAALSISDKIEIQTISGSEKSGFILTTHVNKNKKLDPIPDDRISLIYVKGNGTSVMMTDPKVKVTSTIRTMKKNILKIFPLVDNDFRIHLIHDNKTEIVDNFNIEIVEELSALITLGNEFIYLGENFKTEFEKQRSSLVSVRKSTIIPITFLGKRVPIEIKGWLGAYKTTRGRKAELTDFPDNFISLYANKKLGQFDILPLVGQNKLQEVYVVGQLHVDIFEDSELPDMALSNRQGYRSEDPRYQEVLRYVRTILLPEILKMRGVYANLKKEKGKKSKQAQQQKHEEKFKECVDNFRKMTTKNAATEIASALKLKSNQQLIENVLAQEINKNSPILGIKAKIDSQKKKILISHTYKDKDFSDIIYSMLLFNNVPAEDIIYSNCDDERSRIPEGEAIYEYLKTFFVDSYSTEKIYVIFVTSVDMSKSWGALVEVGAAWITQIQHKVFNIRDFEPKKPLDDLSQWQSSSRDPSGDLFMSNLDADIFCQKIEDVCYKLGYKTKERLTNINYLKSLVKIA